MVAVPEVIPVTSPEVEPIVALPLLLLHVPVPVLLVKVVVSPWHMVEAPDIETGNGLTVIIENTGQPPTI
jgi:hypothetical protein